MTVRLAPANRNIFDTSARGIVIPVNTVGIMGKGLAKECADRYPGVVVEYKALCSQKKLKPGSTACIIRGDFDFWLFATKAHWKYPSTYNWIECGLTDLTLQLRDWSPTYRLAIPALGCGLGELEWQYVYEIMQRVLEPLTQLCDLYPPQEIVA